ncbi:hypothetical protein L596_030229 [Steinernema carpocapsae]|nr:hypothetical protein L596_030229 [Steinernema carpocapsae]
MWLFDPFFGFNISYDASQYHNLPHTTNNLATPLILLTFYIILCATLRFKYVSFESRNMATLKKKIVVQAIAICSFNFLASTFYAYVQFFPPPMYFNVIGHVSWLCCHGGPAVVYLVLNETIKGGVKTMFHSTQVGTEATNGAQTTTGIKRFYSVDRSGRKRQPR